MRRIIGLITIFLLFVSSSSKLVTLVQSQSSEDYVLVEGIVEDAGYNVERCGRYCGKFAAVFLISINNVIQGPQEQLLAHDWEVTYNYTDIVLDMAVGDGVVVYGYFIPEAEGPESFAINVGPKYPGSYVIKKFSVRTNKDVYNVGESITIRVTPTPAYYGVGFWLIIHKPDGSQLRANLSIGEDTITIQADYPLGKYRVELWRWIVYPGAIPELCAYHYFEVMETTEVKVRGYITSDPYHDVWPAGDIWYLGVEISEVLEDPTRNLHVGDDIFVELHLHEGAQLRGFPEEGPKRGDYVEVYGRYWGELWAEKPEHYVKLLTTFTISIYFEDTIYSILVVFPPFEFRQLQEKAEGARQALYPHFEKSLFAQLYYLWHYVDLPYDYTVSKVSVYKDGLLITDKELKVAIVRGLLEYCDVLFRAASPAMLDSWLMQGRGWLKIYNDAASIVRLSNKLSEITYLATIIGPIFESVKNLFGEKVSETIEGEISLFFSLHGGFASLKERYGTTKADTIVDILINRGYISEKNYNPMRLYKNFVEHPEAAVQVIEAIGEQVLNLEIDSNVHALMLNFINEIKSGVIGDFTVGTAIGLLAYFGYGLPASIALKVGLSKAFESFVGGTLPYSLASAIHQSYITPMAKAINEAWESAGQAADAYLNLYTYGMMVANPVGGILNLTQSQIFSGAYGLACLAEFRYYMNSYFYRSRQLFVSESELNMLKDNAQTMFNRAVDWANRIDKIFYLSEALVSQDYLLSEINMLITSAVNNEGSLHQPIPPINIFPEIPENLNGFSLKVKTTDIVLTCGNCMFIVQNAIWYSNFSHSLYIDDPYGCIYLIILAPPEGKYQVKVQNETSLFLKNFKPENETVIIAEAGNITGTEIYFNVINSSVDPESIIPEFPTVIILLSPMILTTFFIVFAKKRLIKKLKH